MTNQIEDNLSKFYNFNDLKIKKTYTNLSYKEIATIKLIPFLLHTNIKGLPGYIETKEMPHGIKNYKITDEVIELTKKVFPSFKIPDTLNYYENIESISIMGSIGSIAQNQNSDFDYWVCINKNEFDKNSYYLFCKKLTEIENWIYEKRNLEVHFFPTDIKSAKASKFGEFEGESCGSSQGDLLKEEYFRSSVVVEGKVPFWWVVPPNITDADYENYLKYIKDSNPEAKNKYIDLGNLSRIEKGEFFGAALWHMIKSLNNPFKSFMKMSLLEKYINTENDTPLLCNILKENVLTENIGIKNIDPYILMYEQMYDYYEKTDNENFLNILRKCFYLKIQPKVTQFDGFEEETIPEKSLIMKDYIRKWKWKESQVRDLDNFDKWSFDKLIQLNSELKNYLIQNFVKLSDYFKNIDVNYSITDKDMTVIGRKLLTYFTGKHYKIDYFYISLHDKPYEDSLTINSDESTGNWLLYRGETVREGKNIKFESKIKESPYLINLLLWITYNTLYNPYKTKLSFYSYNLKISFSEIQNFLILLKEFISDKKKLIKNEYYLSKPFILKCILTLNFESPNSDTIESISFIYLNSYGEVYAEHYKNIQEMFLIIKIIFENYIKTSVEFDDYFKFYVLPGTLKVSDYWKKLIESIKLKLFDKSMFSGDVRIFMTKFENNYLILTAYLQSFNFYAVNNFFKINEFFKKLPSKKFFVSIEPKDKYLELLNLIYSLAKQGEYNFYFFESSDNYLLFIIDELNILDVLQVKSMNLKNIISNYQQIIETKNIQSQEKRNKDKFDFTKKIEQKYFNIKKLPDNKFKIEETKWLT